MLPYEMSTEIYSLAMKIDEMAIESNETFVKAIIMIRLNDMTHKTNQIAMQIDGMAMKSCEIAVKSNDSVIETNQAAINTMD